MEGQEEKPDTGPLKALPMSVPLPPPNRLELANVDVQQTPSPDTNETPTLRLSIGGEIKSRFAMAQIEV
jgi:hypothetical protein